MHFYGYPKVRSLQKDRTAESDIAQSWEAIVETYTIFLLTQAIHMHVTSAKKSHWSVLEHMEGVTEEE